MLPGTIHSPTQPSPGLRRGRRAFSLVEVAMAIGILGFSMVTIMGLIPVAMKTSRQSMDRNIETRMLQTVRSELIKFPSSLLPDTTNFSFDVDGDFLTGTNAGGPREHYRIMVSNQPATVLPSAQSSSNLRTSLLNISNTVRGEARTNSLHLPDNGF